MSEGALQELPGGVLACCMGAQGQVCPCTCPSGTGLHAGPGEGECPCRPSRVTGELSGVLLVGWKAEPPDRAPTPQAAGARHGRRGLSPSCEPRGQSGTRCEQLSFRKSVTHLHLLSCYRCDEAQLKCCSG